MVNRALLHVSGDMTDMGIETHRTYTSNDEVEIVELALNFL